jgi:tetratricopeptide (TPR) repeat protein
MRDDVMKEFWGFDNSAFVKSLESRGFYVAPKSRSNYQQTVFSLASSLNMDYLPIDLEIDTIHQINNFPLIEAIAENRVVNFLKSIGYLYIHLSDDAAETKKNGQADIVIANRKHISSFSRYLLNKTILKNIKLASLDRVQVKRNNILYGFKKLEEIPKIDRPTFTFAHFIMPHEPQAFDENGNIPDPATPASEKYFDEILYANKKIEHLLNSILAGSDTPPIILIQGDHGYLTTASTRPNAAQIKKGYSNLSAYYLPGIMKDKLYKTITPVNSFRLIFDYYFGTQLGLLEDKSYFSTTYTFARKFISIPNEDSLSNGTSAWIKSLKQMILERPNYPEAHTMLGTYYAKLKRFPEAMAAWEKALSIKPDLTWAYIYIAENFIRERNYPKAIKSVEKAIHLNSKIADAYTLLGRASLLLNDRKKSLLAFEKSAQISPTFMKFNDLGAAYFHFGKNKEAILHLKSAVKLNPYQSRTYFNLGSIYLKTKDYRQAIDYNQMAIEHNPDHLKAYINLGNAQFQLNELDQAKATFEKALLKNPALAGIHRNLGIVYSQKDRNPSKAISHFQEYLRLSPNQPDVAQIQSMIQALTIQR